MQRDGRRTEWLINDALFHLLPAVSTNHKNMESIRNLQTLFNAPPLTLVHVITAKELESYQTDHIPIAWYGEGEMHRSTEFIRTIQMGGGNFHVGTLPLSSQTQSYPDLNAKIQSLTKMKRIKSYVVS